MAAKRLFGPAALTNATATKYTVGAGLSAIVRHIHLSNPSVAAIPVTISVGADAAGTRIFDAFSLAAGATYDYFCYLPLAAAEIIAAFAGTTAVVVMTIAGEENVAG